MKRFIPPRSVLALYIGLLGHCHSGLVGMVGTKQALSAGVWPRSSVTETKDATRDIGNLTIIPPGYDKRQFPPLIHEGMPNEISIVVDIFSIPQLDEIKQEIMLEIRVSHFWYDKRLMTDFDHPVELVPDTITSFWTPDSYIRHAKDSKVVSLITKPAGLRINGDKMIKYTVLQMVTISCPMSFQNYPMDQQVCHFELQAFGYNLQHNNYTWRRPPTLSRGIRLSNHDVDIRSYYDVFNSDGMRYPLLGVEIELRRHLGYHLMQTYIPSVIYIVVAYFSFIVPSDVIPGRMALCITTLLTLTTMFNTVRSLTPQVSYLKAIDLWVFACLVFVFSTLAEYTVVIQLTNRAAWQRKVDSHVRSLTGASSLRSIMPTRLIAVAVKGEHGLGTDANGRRRSSAAISNASTAPPKPDEPKEKERLAYTIEWVAKLAYPASFTLFNVIYWSYYLKFSTAAAPERERYAGMESDF